MQNAGVYRRHIGVMHVQLLNNKTTCYTFRHHPDSVQTLFSFATICRPLVVCP